MFIKIEENIYNVNEKTIKRICICDIPYPQKYTHCLTIEYDEDTYENIKYYEDKKSANEDYQKIYNAIHENKDCVDLNDKNEEESK